MSAGVLAVICRMAGQALAFRESHGKSEDARDAQYAEDDEAIATVLELIEAAENFRGVTSGDEAGEAGLKACTALDAALSRANGGQS